MSSDSLVRYHCVVICHCVVIYHLCDWYFQIYILHMFVCMFDLCLYYAYQAGLWGMVCWLNIVKIWDSQFTLKTLYSLFFWKSCKWGGVLIPFTYFVLFGIPYDITGSFGHPCIGSCSPRVWKPLLLFHVKRFMNIHRFFHKLAFFFCYELYVGLCLC